MVVCVPTEAEPARMSRRQTLTLVSMASVNFSSMLCYSILGPFFPNEVSRPEPFRRLVPPAAGQGQRDAGAYPNLCR